MGLNEYLAPVIYEQMLQRGVSPPAIFTGSPEHLQTLRNGIASLRY